MQLVSVKGSPYAARVRLAIYRKELPVEIVFPPREGLKAPEFLALNPIGKIPVLVLDDGSTLPESNVILEYLEDVFPAPSLRPAVAELRAKARLLAQLGDVYVFAALGQLFRQVDPARRDAETVARGAAALGKSLGYLEHHLGPGPFAVGEGYSLADCSLAPVLALADILARHLGLPDPFTTPKLAAYWAALQADPVTARVLEEIAAGMAKMLAK
ncbi:glutathione S-transferase family protein [Ferrovibrio sp.]|uniref:glutathione S-transferase family protein n=1 Tax=Ferrovibrio sp. TaxID=1917215 RepID=UPI001B4D0710|nr:glutathione S-transferase family protein [Ferrovibrio sp.]MBP7064379.1 glutathione S-transferase family protein [Ferrovibrio sp.]